MSADETIAKLQLMLAGGVESAGPAALAMGEVVAKAVQIELSNAAHKPGTPTPSPPGSPPAMISGALQGSVRVEELEPGHVRVGATTPYARIQQLGGMSGLGHLTRTPARPYLEPALRNGLAEGVAAAIEVMSEMIYRE